MNLNGPNSDYDSEFEPNSSRPNSDYDHEFELIMISERAYMVTYTIFELTYTIFELTCRTIYIPAAGYIPATRYKRS